MFSNALWLEYEDVLSRPIWTDETSPEDRVLVFAVLAAAGRWVKIYYGWRPNLHDTGDDFLIELAVAGGRYPYCPRPASRRTLLARLPDFNPVRMSGG